MVAADIISKDFKVLLLWGGSSPPKDLELAVNKLKEKVGMNGKVQVEHESMLSKCGYYNDFLRNTFHEAIVEIIDASFSAQHEKSAFDITISGSNSSTFLHSDELLTEVLRILKPNSSFLLWESKENRPIDDLKSVLTLNGFTSIVQSGGSDQNTYEIKCQKPNFEVGKSSKLPLSFAKKAKNSDAAKIWTLSAADMNDEDVEIIDSDSLLDANDLKQPDLSSAKTDCGTNKAGRRKACKGCTCGLKEELDGSAPPVQKSACGSCYLGDAFRCASCPYLGMPPFKPGEQVTLSDRQLNPDLQA